MIQENKHKKKFFNLLLSNTIISFTILLLAISFAIFYFTTESFPERLFIEQMTSEMIDAGQGATIITLWTLGLSAIIIAIINFIFCLYITWFIFGKSNYYFKDKIIYSKNKLALDIIIKFFIVIFYLLLPFIFVFYLWMIYNKQYNGKFEKSNWILSFWGFKYVSKSSKVGLITSMAFLPVVVPAAAVSYMYSPYQSSYPLKENINEYVTFSNNKENTFIIYFDTTTALYWNIMLKYDEVINKDKSFIKLFPDFTTFFNVLTTACPTVYSNPAIYSGHLYDPYFKNFNVQTKSLINNSGLDTSNMTYDQYYLESFSNLFNMINNQGYKTININNAPYYGETFTPVAGELNKLESDLLNKKGIKINAMDTATLVSQLMKKKIYKFSHMGTMEAYALENISKYLQFNNTSSGVFNYYFNQSHHWPSSYKNSSGKNVADISLYSHHYFGSLYDSIQSLKNILLRFKNEPFLDENNNMIQNENGSYELDGKKYISVYDKTLFIIESDHGYYLNAHKNKNINSILDKLNLSSDQKKKIIDYNQQQYNATLQIKNFKFNKNNKLLKTISQITPEDDNWYNDKRLLTLSDISFITEKLMKEYNGDNSESSSFFREDVINSEYSDYLNSIVLNNPLGIDISKSNNREIYVSWAKNWEYEYNETKFKFMFFDKFISNDNFFNDSNFVKENLTESLFKNK